jgi:hypothetical protein
MSADEIREISADKWSDEIWGTSTESCRTISRPPMKLVFYFGRNDHWVAEQTRDDIIQARGPKSMAEAGNGATGPKMVVCEDGVLHGFCIREFGFFGSLLFSNGLDKFSWYEGCQWLIRFCLLFHLGHNEVMARKVGVFIRDIMTQQDKREKERWN